MTPKVSFHIARILPLPACAAADCNVQLKDPSLLKTDVCYVNGEWIKAKSGKTFEVTGETASSRYMIARARR